MSDDEHQLRAERDEGHRARMLVENPLWVEAWDRIETGLMETWRNSQPADSERRESIYLQLDAARAVRRYFEQLVLTGEMAEMTLSERSDGRSTAQH